MAPLELLAELRGVAASWQLPPLALHLRCPRRGLLVLAGRGAERQGEPCRCRLGYLYCCWQQRRAMRGELACWRLLPQPL